MTDPLLPMDALHMNVQFQQGDFALDVRLDSKPGITALYGRSGSGKSTVVNILAGLITPDCGTIRIGSDVLFDKTRNINVLAHNRHVGCVFQDARLFPHLNVTKNLMYGINRLDVNKRSEMFCRVTDVLDLHHLLHRRPNSLSGGEKQRVAIGRTLLSNPNILLMDEPLASLDSARKSEILPFIEQLTKAFHIPVVYVSHAMEEVIRLADTLALIDDGKIIAAGSVEDITGRLDLSPLTGRYEAGAVITAHVSNHDMDLNLTRLNVMGHVLYAPKINVPVGQGVRIRLRARDIALALTPPLNTSILNQLPVIIKAVKQGNGPHVEVALTIQAIDDESTQTPQTILARITRKSFKDLHLAPGKPAHALIKAVAIDRHSFGGLGCEITKKGA